MSKFRRAARVDNNQKYIVDQLRSIPGVTVEVNHDDILVGYKGRTYWFEIKNPEVANANGRVFESKIKDDQKRIRRTWTGHYKIVSTLEEILKEIGIKLGD